MSIQEWAMSRIARQLSKPEGLPGRIVGLGLNRGNREIVNAAVDAAQVGAGQTAADIGFGGGLGLQLLLDRVRSGGHVDGVEFSDTMLKAARRRHRTACRDGRMTLHAGSLQASPLDDSSVDGLITVNTIYFVHDLAGAFREIARVLRPQGHAVIGIGDPQVMASMAVTDHGFLLRSIDDVAALMEESGMVDVRHEQVGNGRGRPHLLIGSPALVDHDVKDPFGR